jgi:hypothetical protein
MKAKLIIFPYEDGFNVAVWGAWTEGTMRVRSFDNRTTMIACLENLRLIRPEDVHDLENFTFMKACPIYVAEIDQEALEAHGFRRA